MTISSEACHQRAATFSYRGFAHLLGPAFLAHVAIVFPIMMAARPLLDDMGRGAWGYFMWTDFGGRFLADGLFYLINLGSPAVSVPYMNQLIAALLLAASASLLAAALGMRNGVLAALAALPLGAHPYFLENLSYVFDSPQMAAGVLTSTAAAVTIWHVARWYGVLLAAALVFCSFGLYQPTVNIYFCTAAFFVAKASLTNSGIPVRLIRDYAASGLLASCGYWLVVEGFIFPFTDEYTSHYSEVAPLNDIAWTVWNNSVEYWRLVWRDWAGSILFFFISAVVILGSLFMVLDFGRRKLPVRNLALAIGILVLAIFFQYGGLLILENQRWVARSFVSFGCLPALLGLQIVAVADGALRSGQRIIGAACLVPVVGLAYSLYLFAYALGGGLLAQKDYEDVLSTRILDDLAELPDAESLRYFALIGSAPVSLELLNSAQKFPVIPHIVQNPLDSGWRWGSILLVKKGLWLEVSPEALSPEAIAQSGREPVLKSVTYDIYVFDQTAVIVFDENPTRWRGL
jgi:hypothetical protein